MRTWLLAVAIVTAGAAGCAVSAVPRGPAARESAPPASSGPARTVASNVRRADYAGSAACARCHGAIYARFARSAMHGMTRIASDLAPAAVHAPFDGATFKFKDDVVTLESHAGKRFVRVESRARGTTRYEVTRVIGGRVREDFAGVPFTEKGGGGPERVLPISWLIDARRFRYKGYSVMIRERAGVAEGAVWSETCIFCHNTSPYLLTLLASVAGGRVPAYQGVVVDRLLPQEKRWEYEITDEDALVDAVRDEVAAFGGVVDARDRRRALGRAASATRAGFRGEHLVEVGVGCESCHGGSREHAADPRAHPTFLPVGAFFRVKGEHSRAEAQNRVCARCHQVLFTRYPWTWEGARRDSARAGGSHISSGEARDMILGACASELACSVCHDPHETGGGRARDLETAAGNDVCTRCHTAYASRNALAAHTRHAPDGPAGACVACHMPKKNMSLASRLTRYHRIGSPTDPARVMLDRPLECALCHADKSVEEVVRDMERLFGKRYERNQLAALYGDLDENVMVATLARGKPHEQAVALAALGETKRRAAAPVVAEALAHPYPLVREYALDALAKIVGRPCDVDLAADPERIAAEAQKCVPGDARTPIALPAAEPRSSRGVDPADDGED